VPQIGVRKLKIAFSIFSLNKQLPLPARAGRDTQGRGILADVCHRKTTGCCETPVGVQRFEGISVPPQAQLIYRTFANLALAPGIVGVERSDGHCPFRTGNPVVGWRHPIASRPRSSKVYAVKLLPGKNSSGSYDPQTSALGMQQLERLAYFALPMAVPGGRN